MAPMNGTKPPATQQSVYKDQGCGRKYRCSRDQSKSARPRGGESSSYGLKKASWTLYKTLDLPQRQQLRINHSRLQPYLPCLNKIYRYLAQLHLWQNGYWTNKSPIYFNLRDDCGWVNKNSYQHKVSYLCQIDEYELKVGGIEKWDMGRKIYKNRSVSSNKSQYQSKALKAKKTRHQKKI